MHRAGQRSTRGSERNGEREKGKSPCIHDLHRSIPAKAEGGGTVPQAAIF